MAEGHASAIVSRFPAVSALYKQSLDPNCPENKLTDLGEAVRRFDQAVSRLQRTIEQHNRLTRAHGSGDGLGMHALSLDAGFMTRAHEYNQNFRNSLASCEMLLSDRAVTRSTPETFSRSVQQQLVDLKQSLTAQTQALILFLSEIPAVVPDEGVRRVAIVPGSYSLAPAVRQYSFGSDPLSIPDSIIRRFRQLAERNSPSGFTSPEEFPVPLGLAVLKHHYDKSTAHSPPGIKQTIHQFLSLLIMQWMIQCIERLYAFKALGPTDPDRLDLVRYRTAVISERRRSDLTKFTEPDLLRLPDHQCVIWPPVRIEDRLHNVLQARNNSEKQILDMKISTYGRDSGYTLKVMRLLRSPSGTAVRVVRKRSYTDPEDTPIDAFKDSLRPHYAFRPARSRTYAMSVQKADYYDDQIFEFATTSDLYRVQRALTCFSVVSDFENVDWAIATSKVFGKSPQGEARRLHIWLWDPDDALSKTAKEAGYGTDADSRQSVVSILTANTATTILHDGGKPNVSVSTKDRTRYSSTEVVEAVMPYEPLLVMYTEHGDQNCLLSLELNSQVEVDPTTCKCTKNPDKCHRVVLRSRSGPLYFNRIKAKGNDSNSIPDLNLLARSYRKGQEAHPGLRNANLVERFEGGHIALDFPTVELRKIFNKHFALAYRLRASIESTDQILSTRAQFLADRPEGHTNTRDRIVGPSHLQALHNQAKTSTSSFGGSSGGRYRSSTSDYEHNDASSSRSSSFTTADHSRHNSSSVAPDHSRHNSSSLATDLSRHSSGPPVIPPISELGDRNSTPSELHSQPLFASPTTMTAVPHGVFGRSPDETRLSPISRPHDSPRSPVHDLVSPCSPQLEAPRRQHVIMNRGIDPAMMARKPAQPSTPPINIQRRNVYELQ